MGDNGWTEVSRKKKGSSMEANNSFQSKEDMTRKISFSVFVTNFPEHFSSQDLWNVCNTYVRFHREPKVVSAQKTKGKEGLSNNSFATVLKSGYINPKIVDDSSLAIVLDDSCVLNNDLSNALMGKIKDINALPNLYNLLENEGCSKTKENMCKHVGVSSWFSELLPANDSFVTDERLVWVSVEGLPSKSWTHNTFAKIVSQWGSLSDVEEEDDSSLPYKKICVITKPHILIDKRIKVIIKGCVYWVRVKELEVWSPEFNCQFSDNGSDKGASDDEILGNHGINGECNTDNEVDYVSESSCMKDDGVASEHVDKSHNAKSPSEDPFGIYDILNRKPDNSNHKSDDPTFPPGFTPADENVIPMNSKDDSNDKPKGDFQSNKEGQSSSKSVNTSILKIKSGGSILDVMESVVEIGQTMGYNMEGCIKNMEAIIGDQGDFPFLR
ncbi:hypothetical protein Tco_0452564 [Tanacetum coccineum]